MPSQAKSQVGLDRGRKVSRRPIIEPPRAIVPLLVQHVGEERRFDVGVDAAQKMSELNVPTADRFVGF